MKLNFTKMHGIGNDYIYINCFDMDIPDPQNLSIKLSDRRFSIGGDGLVLICRSTVADAKMRMFNTDGSEGKMCGNAIRCVGKYLYDNKITSKTNIKIETLSGIKELELFINNNQVESVKVNMGMPILTPSKIPVNIDLKEIINYPITIKNKVFNITAVSMGNPHAVTYVNNVNDFPVENYGRDFEINPLFPEKINTEFVEVIDDTTLKMRVWERGSGETFACGTGASASVVASVLNNKVKQNTDITVKLLGGDLKINYDGKNVFMTGSATKSFEGTIEI